MLLRTGLVSATGTRFVSPVRYAARRTVSRLVCRGFEARLRHLEAVIQRDNKGVVDGCQDLALRQAALELLAHASTCALHVCFDSGRACKDKLRVSSPGHSTRITWVALCAKRIHGRLDGLDKCCSHVLSCEQEHIKTLV